MTVLSTRGQANSKAVPLGILGLAATALPSWLSAVAGVIAAASTVTALTPTPADDKWVGKLYRIIEVLALNIGYAKDAPDNKTSSAK